MSLLQRPNNKRYICISSIYLELNDSFMDGKEIQDRDVDVSLYRDTFEETEKS